MANSRLAVTAVVVKIAVRRIKFVKWKLYFIKQSTRVVVGGIYTIFLRNAVVVVGDKKLDATLESCDYKQSDCNVNALCFV